MLHIDRLLAEVLVLPAARAELIGAAVDDPRLGATLQRAATSHLAWLSPEDLAATLIAGLAHDELRGGRGLAYEVMDRGDFVVPPLPNLLFTRDSSVWVGDEVAVTSLAMPARHRESTITAAVYTHHPRFAGVEQLYSSQLEHLEGGDVLLLSPGVVAVGVGERTTPGGAERLARRLFARGLAHDRARRPDRPAAGHDAPGHHRHDGRRRRDGHVPGGRRLAGGLDGHRRRGASATTPTTSSSPSRGPQPFLVAAAAAMGIDRLRVIDTGLDPVTAEREQWDDGNNTLALAPRLAVAYERNTVTNAALEAAGIEVVAHRRLRAGQRPGRPPVHELPGPARPALTPEAKEALPRVAAPRMPVKLPLPWTGGGQRRWARRW